MAQLFSRQATLLFRAALAGAVIVVAGGVALGLGYVRSGSYWNVGIPADQPIPFRHDLHAGKLGIDCGFCHSTAERASGAGMPSAHTCLACHSQVWQGASVLEPLRSSAALNQPIRWSSVHRLPSHAYFHHGVHVSSGIACASCHGNVADMKRTVKAETLSMGWCLDCHRATELKTPAIQRPAQSTAAGEGGEAAALGSGVVRSAAPLLVNCSTCHR